MRTSFDGFAQSGVMVDALLLDRLQLLLIGSCRSNSTGLTAWVNLSPACSRKVLRASPSNLPPISWNCAERLSLRVLERFDLLLERFLAFLVAGFERSEVLCGGPVRIALLDHLVQLQPQIFDGLARAGAIAATDQPPNQAPTAKAMRTKAITAASMTVTPRNIMGTLRFANGHDKRNGDGYPQVGQLRRMPHVHPQDDRPAPGRARATSTSRSAMRCTT